MDLYKDENKILDGRFLDNHYCGFGLVFTIFWGLAKIN